MICLIKPSTMCSHASLNPSKVWTYIITWRTHANKRSVLWNYKFKPYTVFCVIFPILILDRLKEINRQKTNHINKHTTHSKSHTQRRWWNYEADLKQVNATCWFFKNQWCQTTHTWNFQLPVWGWLANDHCQSPVMLLANYLHQST